MAGHGEGAASFDFAATPLIAAIFRRFDFRRHFRRAFAEVATLIFSRYAMRHATMLTLFITRHYMPPFSSPFRYAATR